uniref:Uncharacterized protein n=1 Tax=Arundo donax TaxID=35708 RepID=A0A0A8ZDV9_ARUDO
MVVSNFHGWLQLAAAHESQEGSTGTQKSKRATRNRMSTLTGVWATNGVRGRSYTTPSLLQA